jgi:hypothetical protein
LDGKRADEATEADPMGEEQPSPDSGRRWALFAFRELSRADFCFIVLVLALAGWTWLLLPAGALGAHAYWVTRLFTGARDDHP